MRSVLVVDDDAAVARLVAAVLRRDGLLVELAADGPQALERLATERYDVVLTDMTMPGMSGLQLLREAQARGHRAPFLLMSAFLDPATEQTLRDDPAVTGILRKPFDIVRLLSDVRGVLQRVDAHGAVEVEPRLAAPPSLALAPLWLVRWPFPPAARPLPLAAAGADSPSAERSATSC